MQVSKIIFQDNDILIISKPSGLVVNRAESVKGSTLQDWIEKKFLNSQIFKLPINVDKKDFIKRSGIVHRLDKDTSGVMIIAKNSNSFKNLQLQFKKREVKKSYLALVHGYVEPRVGDIKLPLARKTLDRMKFAVKLGGRSSETKYKVVDYYEKDKEKLTLLNLQPKTGRTHQLRVHLKHLNYPIVSDPVYLGVKRYKQDLNWCPRLFLHAEKISFRHPSSQKLVSYSSNLNDVLTWCLKSLRKT